MLSPIFPSLLTLILLIAYKIYFEHAILCDDGCPPLLLDQLKINLNVEIGRISCSNKDLLELIKTIDEVKIKQGELNGNQSVFFQKQVEIRQKILIQSLHRSTEIEDSIKKIDPSFNSGFRRSNADLLRSLGEDIRR
jgi:hypothetical protein